MLSLRALLRSVLPVTALCATFSGGCSPGFFAQEPVTPEPPKAESAESDSASAGRVEGSGCSPKGCVPAEPRPRDTSVEHLARRVPPPPKPHPLKGKVNAEIERLVKNDLASLGSMSFGTATRGGLLNAVQVPAHERWQLVQPSHSWGTEETVRYLARAVDRVRELHPGGHPLFVGDLSQRRGGYLRPHLSHQTGRDADISYYYTHGARWYARAHAGNLDRARSWELVRTLIAETDVHFIFMDRSVQRLLRSYAEDIGEDRDWLNSIFRGAGAKEPPIIRHEPGHATHIHVRFYNPIAEETARRCYSALLRQKKLLPMRYNITHEVKRGETLIGLAKRYGTSVRAIQRANGMKKTSMLQAKRKYFIPREGPAGPTARRVPPPRRIPPARTPTDGPIASR